MFTRSFRIFVSAIIVALLACVSLIPVLWQSLFPKDLTSYHVGSDTAPRFFVGDVDLDGDDDIFVYDLDDPQQYIKVVDQDLNPIDQHSLHIPGTEAVISWADVNMDGDLEFGMSYRQSDSVCIQFLDCKDGKLTQEKQFSFPQSQGQVGVAGWDGYYDVIGMLDANDDQIDDIIFYVFAGRSYQPRALFAYDVSMDEEIWRYDFGAAVGWFQIEDFNGDGYKEILAGSLAFANGPSEGVNGTDDHHSCILMLDRHGTLLWKRRMGGIFSWCTVTGFAYNGDDRANIVAAVTPTDSTALSSSDDSTYRYGRIVSFSGKTGKMIRELKLGTRPEAFQVITQQAQDSEPMGHVLTYGSDGRLRFYDYNLRMIRRSKPYVALEVESFAGIGNENGPAILISSSNNELTLLDTYFSEVASYSPGSARNLFASFIRSSTSEQPRIVLSANQVSVFNSPEMPPDILAGLVWWLSENSLTITVFSVFLILLLLLVNVLPVIFAARISLKAGELDLPVGLGLIGISSSSILTYANQYSRQLLKLPKRWRWKRLSELFGRELGARLIKQMYELTKCKSTASGSVFPMTTSNGINFLSFDRAGSMSIMRKRILFISVKPVQDKSTEELVTDWFELSSRITHRIKTPLTNSLKSIELAQRLLADFRTGDPNPIARELDEAGSRIRESMRMVEKFLRFRFKEVNIREYNLNDLIQEVVDYSVLPLSAPLDCNIEVDDPKATIKTDHDLFKELFTLIIQNSADAVDSEQGKIVIRTRLARNMQDSRSETPVAVVTISDNGCGIGREELPKVFEPFFTTKSKSGGTGLGLAMAKKICEALDADISIESQAGQGTTTKITFRGKEV